MPCSAESSPMCPGRSKKWLTSQLPPFPSPKVSTLLLWLPRPQENLGLHSWALFSVHSGGNPEKQPHGHQDLTLSQPTTAFYLLPGLSPGTSRLVSQNWCQSSSSAHPPVPPTGVYLWQMTCCALTMTLVREHEPPHIINVLIPTRSPSQTHDRKMGRSGHRTPRGELIVLWG